MPFFSLLLKIFVTLGITQVNLISALAYRKKSLHYWFGGWVEARVELFLSSYSSRFRCSRCFAI